MRTQGEAIPSPPVLPRCPPRPPLSPSRHGVDALDQDSLFLVHPARMNPQARLYSLPLPLLPPPIAAAWSYAGLRPRRVSDARCAVPPWIPHAPSRLCAATPQLSPRDCSLPKTAPTLHLACLANGRLHTMGPTRSTATRF
jgi:hypothetical protein